MVDAPLFTCREGKTEDSWPCRLGGWQSAVPRIHLRQAAMFERYYFRGSSKDSSALLADMSHHFSHRVTYDWPVCSS